MKKITIIIGIVLMHLAAFSQTDSTSRNKYIKTYSTISTLKLESLPRVILPNIFAIGKVTKKGNYYEIQSGGINFRKNASVTNTYLSTGFDLKFEHGRKVLKSLKSEKWNTFLALRASYTGAYNSVRPLVSSSFNYFQFNSSVNVSLIPKIEYNFNNRLYMDFSVPLNLFTYFNSQNVTENPGLPLEERKTTSNSINVFNNYTSPVVGFGLRI